jgi:hypothetical protein
MATLTKILSDMYTQATNHPGAPTKRTLRNGRAIHGDTIAMRFDPSPPPKMHYLWGGQGGVISTLPFTATNKPLPAWSGSLSLRTCPPNLSLSPPGRGPG